MIHINLVPDVKLELVYAQRHRRLVIMIAAITAIVAASITILLALYVFAYQNIDMGVKTKAIHDKHETFVGMTDVQNSVTIANQIAKIDETHDAKSMTSRLFDVLAVASSKGTDNSVSVTTIDLDTKQKTLTVTGQTDKRGFGAADVFRKNIEGIKVYYVEMQPDGTYDTSDTKVDEKKTPNFIIASNVVLSDLTLARNDNDSQQHVSFKLSLTYDERLFSSNIHILRIDGLGRGNVTDSYSRLPQSLFTAVDAKDEAKQ